MTLTEKIAANMKSMIANDPDGKKSPAYSAKAKGKNSCKGKNCCKGKK
jgi:hypothetical protein